MAGWGKLSKDREVVARALIALAQDSDAEVKWHATQAIGSVHAAAGDSVPALITILKGDDRTLANKAAESLGEFGAEAKTALPTLIEQLGKSEDDFAFACAIREIGIDQMSADQIANVTMKQGAEWLLIPLCTYPEAATAFLRRNPQAVDIPTRDRYELIGFIREPKPALKELRDLLYSSEQLPLAIISQLGDSHFLPLIERKAKTASKHQQAVLAACSRACGGPAGRVVVIDESHPGDFKPMSAWPNVDRRRLSVGSSGHGDGYTEVIITGQILSAPDKPAADVKFFRTNDAMLFGTPTRQEEPVVFDPKTGRFVFVTHVFAAYSVGKNQPEPGPYQTGSSQILIESEGSKSLQVQFFDEMPDVRITLRPVQK